MCKDLIWKVNCGKVYFWFLVEEIVMYFFELNFNSYFSWNLYENRDVEKVEVLFSFWLYIIYSIRLLYLFVLNWEYCVFILFINCVWFG